MKPSKQMYAKHPPSGDLNICGLPLSTSARAELILGFVALHNSTARTASVSLMAFNVEAHQAMLLKSYAAQPGQLIIAW